MSCLFRFVISPLFFLMGFLSYGAEKSVGSHMSHLTQMGGMNHSAMDHAAMGHGAMDGGAMDAGTMMSTVDIFGMSVSQGIAAVITSMWLMYVLMGLAHITPWIDLFTGKRTRGL